MASQDQQQEEMQRPVEVLAVDNSPTARRAIAGLLARDRAIRLIGQAETGRQAVRMCDRLKPGVVLTDAVMPDMDGVEATRKLMEHGAPPVLIVTAYAESADMDVVFRATGAGAADVVSKSDVLGPDADPQLQTGSLSRAKGAVAARPKPCGEHESPHRGTGKLR